MPVDPLLNRQFGPYILLRRLAVGGMAEIYLAMKQGPEHIRKLLVLKCISAQNNNNPEYVRMFYHEAELALRMSHPNIVQTWDVEKIEGRHTMAVEYLYGVTLDEILKKVTVQAKILPLSIALWITVSVLDALEYVHTLRDLNGEALHIVHRDVTPQNIFVRFDGQCKLFDFGVSTSSRDPQQCEKGMLIGKYAYMSPEQCMGEHVDGRSDTFSLAIVLYEMLTGHPLFTQENDIKTLEAVNHSKIESPSKFVPALSPRLCDIVMKALQRSPDARYADARSFADALRSYMKEEGIEQSMFPLRQYVFDAFRTEIEECQAFMQRAVGEVAQKFPSKPLCCDSSRECEELVPINEGSINISVSKLTAIPMTPLPHNKTSCKAEPTGVQQVKKADSVEGINKWKLATFIVSIICVLLILALCIIVGHSEV